MDGGRDPTWHPPRLQVSPVSPNLRTTCDQASVILIQNYVEDVCFYSELCRTCLFFYFLSTFSVRKKKATCSQPDAFLVGKFSAPAALVGSKFWPFWCTQKTRNPPLPLDVLQMCMLLNCVLECKFLNPTIQRAGHHTARVKSHGGLKKDNEQY